MKHLVATLALVLLVGLTGCTTSNRPYERGTQRRTQTVRQDPVVGRTTDGRRIYEDRSGRLYTRDRHGNRTYRERTRSRDDRRSDGRRYDDDDDRYERGKKTPPGHSGNKHKNGKGKGHKKHHDDD